MSAVIQTVWAELIATTLVDAGVTTAVISPGSRSTPLTAALAGDGRLALPTLVDERAAGFFALGLARASGAPVALVCTSGTAAAHYFPALIEASEAGIPLVVLTADRPAELHACAAPQTIDQVKLYGGFVRAYLDLGAPDGSALALRALRRKIAQAVATARGPAPGPVHVEIPLRKPLEPARPVTATEREAAVIAIALSIEPLVRATAPQARADDALVAELAAAIAARRRGVIVAGPAPLAHAGARAAVYALAARAGYPVLAEAGSQLRFGPRGDVVACDRWDLALGAPRLAEILAPELILQIGADPVAAAWPPFLARHRGAARWVIAAGGWPDPDSSARGLLRGDVADAVARIAAGVAVPADAAWLDAWAAADERATTAADAALAAHRDGEPALLRAVVDALPAGAALVLGNSLPVRVIDQVAAGGGRDLAVITQRGANGIDGLIAGAAGAAAAGRPTALLLGDVSFAHDVGGLAAARLAGAPLAIVVVDNGGGRIFDGLPVAGSGLPPGAFERHWTTPAGVDPVAAAAAFGVAGRVVRDPDEAAAAVRAALAGAGPVVLHAPVAAAGALAFRRDVTAAIGAAADDVASILSPAALVAEGARR